MRGRKREEETIENGRGEREERQKRLQRVGQGRDQDLKLLCVFVEESVCYWPD